MKPSTPITLAACSLLTLLAACQHAAPPVAVADDDADPRAAAWNALSMQLVITPDPQGATEKRRLAIVVSNPTDHPLTFKLYEGSFPEAFTIAVVESPQTRMACGSNAEPPFEMVTLAPHESRTSHPFAANNVSLYTPPTAPPFNPDGKTWHIRAAWGNHTQDLALKLD